MDHLAPRTSHASRVATMLVVLGLLTVATCRATDYADARRVDDWLHHPVLGEPSFDAFAHSPANPVLRGTPPWSWPVNGFLFLDPRSGRHYAYVGEYGEGYVNPPSRCRLFRRSADGAEWTDLGVVLRGDPALFDRDGHTPDVSVVLADGRYHMVYDWGEKDFNAEGGLAYAWADQPEGPWHRDPTPITRNSSLPKLLDRYRRTYAATLIRRAHDWLIVGMMDDAPRAWAQFVMTAPRPEGPWSDRILVRHVERDEFHPPLLEFYPAFVHAGSLYTPSTSVARNRNYNVLFRVPLERATDPDAWQIARAGSLWHADDVEHEWFGLWGQTFSGQVDDRGVFWALFPSRDSQGRGTINVAHRPWRTPLRRHGFVLSAHDGPTFTCLRKSALAFRLDVGLELRGTVRLYWDHRGWLGPSAPSSDAVPHARVNSDAVGLECSSESRTWRVVRVGAAGTTTLLGSGRLTAAEPWRFRVERTEAGVVSVRREGRPLWQGGPQSGVSDASASGALAWWLEPHAHLAVSEFELSARARPVELRFLGSEALLGAGADPARWEEQFDARFKSGAGWVARETGARVKWNVPGDHFTLWSPRGPEFGSVEVRLDGRVVATIDLRTDTQVDSSPVWTSGRLRPGSPGHAIVLQSRSGRLPVDALISR